MKKQKRIETATPVGVPPQATGSRLSFVVVYGPPATGKTLNRETLRKHYKCRAVMDDWPSLPRELRGQSGCVLILSNTEKVRDPYDRRRVLQARTVKIEDAAKALGAKWITPRHANDTAMASPPNTPRS